MIIIIHDDIKAIPDFSARPANQQSIPIGCELDKL